MNNKKTTKKRCPFDHLTFKNTLTTKLGKKLVDEMVNTLGLTNYSMDILEEVQLANGRRIDVVLLIKEPDERKNGCSLTIGLELKQHSSDFKADDKILEYLGYTDYFFLWLEDRKVMRNLALEKFGKTHELGVIIHRRRDCLFKLPDKQIVVPSNRLTEKQILKGKENRRKRLQYLSGRRNIMKQ